MQARGTELQRLERMLLIRRFEERVIELHAAREFEGHYHVYIGQEATAVAACEQLAAADYLYSTHRNHGHLLAKGADPDRMLAEIMGRSGGYNRGKGGTLHLAAADLHVPLTTALVGSSLPIATGSALSLKTRGIRGMVIAFFGDGTLEEGAFYEAINLAGVWGLPILYVCENNSIPPEERKLGQYPSSTLMAPQLTDVPAGFGMPVHVADGTDTPALLELFGRVAAEVRDAQRPQFVEVRNSRWPGSFNIWPELVGGPTDLAWGWGEAPAQAELAAWNRTSDPVLHYAAYLVEKQGVERETLLELDRAVIARIDRAAEFARKSPLPDPAEAYEGVYASEERSAS